MALAPAFTIPSLTLPSPVPSLDPKLLAAVSSQSSFPSAGPVVGGRARRPDDVVGEETSGAASSALSSTPVRFASSAFASAAVAAAFFLMPENIYGFKGRAWLGWGEVGCMGGVGGDGRGEAGCKDARVCGAWEEGRREQR